MRKFRILKYVLLTLFILFLIAFYVILASPQQTSDEKLTEHFDEKGIYVDIQYTSGVRSFKSLGASQPKTTVLFVHGAPGSGDQFNSYLVDSVLLSNADVMSLDRQGYGYSQYGEPELDMAIQADNIVNLVSQRIDSSHNIILVSHSYGGPICAIMSALDIERITGHIMLCPVIDPDHERQFWFSGIPLWWPFRYFSSGAMKVAAHEKLTHVEELRKAERHWRNVKVRTLHIQGAKDWLAPIENAEYVSNHFDPEYTEVRILENESHFIPFNKKELVIELILEMIHKDK